MFLFVYFALRLKNVFWYESRIFEKSWKFIEIFYVKLGVLTLIVGLYQVIMGLNSSSTTDEKELFSL